MLEHDPRTAEDSRDRDADPRDRDVRERTDPRDVFLRELDLPRGPERERVFDCDLEDTLRGSPTEVKEIDRRPASVRSEMAIPSKTSRRFPTILRRHGHDWKPNTA
jgi:hypothetical protein